MGKLAPIIGNWYRAEAQNMLFEVVAIDDHTGAIEIQYASGDLDEIEQDDWMECSLKSSPPPDDSEENYEQDNENDEARDDSVLWGLHLNDMDLQGFDSLDWKEPY